MKLRKKCLPRWNSCEPTAQSAWKWENSDTRSIWSDGVRAPTLKITCDCWDKPQNASLGQSPGNNRSTNPASNESLWMPSRLKDESPIFNLQNNRAFLVSWRKAQKRAAIVVTLFSGSLRRDAEPASAENGCNGAQA